MIWHKARLFEANVGKSLDQPCFTRFNLAASLGRLRKMKMHYADTPFGQLHYAEEGEGESIICLHQTPRSWDEFRELIPLLSKNYRVIAMDMYGFGQSAKLAPPQQIEDFSAGVIALMDSLNINQTHILGHHTGALVAFDSAARFPARFLSLMISSMPFTDAAYRNKHISGDGVDDSEITEDGSHLLQNWAKRQQFYPKNRPDILNRFIHDSLNFGVNPIEGHIACARYVIERKFDAIKMPVLILAANEDPFSFPSVAIIREHLVNASKIEINVIDGGMIPLMEIKADQVSSSIITFLSKLS